MYALEGEHQEERGTILFMVHHNIRRSLTKQGLKADMKTTYK